MIQPLKIKPAFESLFFDMDGVLYDSMPNHAYTWVESFKQAGIAFSEKEAYLNEGRTGPSTIDEAFLKYLGRHATPEEVSFIYQTKTNLMQEAPVPEIMPMMQDILNFTREAGIKIVIVTGSKQPSLLARLERDFGIEVHQVVSGFDVKKGKPHPEPYLMALDKTKSDKTKALVIENAPLGIESATGAGIKTVAVNTGLLEDEILYKAGASLVLPDTSHLHAKWISILEGAI